MDWEFYQSGFFLLRLRWLELKHEYKAWLQFNNERKGHTQSLFACFENFPPGFGTEELAPLLAGVAYIDTIQNTIVVRFATESDLKNCILTFQHETVSARFMSLYEEFVYKSNKPSPSC